MLRRSFNAFLLSGGITKFFLVNTKPDKITKQEYSLAIGFVNKIVDYIRWLRIKRKIIGYEVVEDKLKRLYDGYGLYVFIHTRTDHYALSYDIPSHIVTNDPNSMERIIDKVTTVVNEYLTEGKEDMLTMSA